MNQTLPKPDQKPVVGTAYCAYTPEPPVYTLLKDHLVICPCGCGYGFYVDYWGRKVCLSPEKYKDVVCQDGYVMIKDGKALTIKDLPGIKLSEVRA